MKVVWDFIIQTSIILVNTEKVTGDSRYQWGIEWEFNSYGMHEEFKTKPGFSPGFVFFRCSWILFCHLN